MDVPTTGIFYAHSNTSQLTIQGSCASDETITLSGSASQSGGCANFTFSFVVSQSADGIYPYLITATSGQHAPLTVTLYWVRDTVLPAAPQVISPNVSPVVAAGNSLLISGTCEADSVVELTGDASNSQYCAEEAGSGWVFAFTVTQTVDGLYDYALTQTDRAGNESLPSNVQWQRDSSVPATPTILSPTSASTYISNDDFVSPPVALSGGCLGSAYEVSLSIDAGAPTTAACVGGTYQFPLSDPGEVTTEYAVTQALVAGGPSSAAASLQWTIDRTAPGAPAITNPTVDPVVSPDPLAVQGNCEDSATVYLDGATADSTACVGGMFAFSLSAGSDGTYDYEFSQEDPAGNLSPISSLQWIRLSTAIPIPTIVAGSNPYYSNESSFNVTGECLTGLTVYLDVNSGYASDSTECAGGTYSMTFSDAEGTYAFTVTQGDGVSTSDPATQTWVRDITAPDLDVSDYPAEQELGTSASFTFSSTDGTAAFECDLDGTGYATCASPAAYTPGNGTHTMSIRARDPAGNLTSWSLSPYSWSQEDYDTISLYHLDGASLSSYGADGSLYTGAYANDLLDTGTTYSSGGGIGSTPTDARTFINAAGVGLLAADSAKHGLLTETMTAEVFVRFTTLPGTNNRDVILVAQSGTGDLSWKFVFRRGASSTTYLLGFRGTVQSNPGVVSSVLGTTISPTPVTGTWYHAAVTWDRGNVALYFNGNQVGTGTIGATPGSEQLSDSSAPVRIGLYNSTVDTLTLGLIGRMDEVRLSKTIRYSGATYTAPTEPFTAD